MRTIHNVCARRLAMSRSRRVACFCNISKFRWVAVYFFVVVVYNFVLLFVVLNKIFFYGFTMCRSQSVPAVCVALHTARAHSAIFSVLIFFCSFRRKKKQQRKEKKRKNNSNNFLIRLCNYDWIICISLVGMFDFSV